MARPALRKSVVDYVCGHYPNSERRARRLVRLTRRTRRYVGCRDPRLDLRERMRELARARVRFGYRPSDIRREAGALLSGEYAALAQRLNQGPVSLREFLSRPP